MNVDHCYALFAHLAEAIPEPKTELNYQTPFELLIAVVLSAQATDKSVNRATEQLFPIANTPETLLALGENGLKHYIKTIGLFNNKAANIMTLCHQLLEHHHGIVPDSREQLQALAGVGRKTANVILNTAFGQETIAVDTHIFRVANRTGLATGTTVLAVEKQLEQRVPSEYRKNAHHLLILHGRYTCKAKHPNCSNCSIADYCEFHQQIKSEPVKFSI